MELCSKHSLQCLPQGVVTPVYAVVTAVVVVKIFDPPFQLLTFWRHQNWLLDPLTTASTIAVRYAAIVKSTVWPLDEPLDLLTLVSSASILTAAKTVTKGMYMEVTTLVSWEASLLVACYSIQLFNSGAHRFKIVWCSHANKDNPHRSRKHLLQNWTVVREYHHCCHRTHILPIPTLQARKSRKQRPSCSSIIHILHCSTHLRSIWLQSPWTPPFHTLFGAQHVYALCDYVIITS